MPQLLDTQFERSVVLMLEHGAGGAMGLVINREAPMTFGALSRANELRVSPGREADHLFLGGPVEQHRGFVLHDLPHVAEKTEVLPGLFLSVTNDSLGPILLNPTATVRFCLGYAGWGPGQVEKELTEGAWLFTEVNVDTVLHAAHGQIWSETIKSMGVDPAWLVTSGGIN